MSLRYGDDINRFSGRMFDRGGAAVPVVCSTKASGRAYVGLLMGLAITVLIMAWGLWFRPNHLELKLFDQRMRLFSPVVNSDDHVVIAIDDNSLGQVGRWPWPRRHIANMVEVCKRCGARYVLLDILMPEEQRVKLVQPGITDVSAYEPESQLIGDPRPQVLDNDAILSSNLRQAGNVILSFHATLNHQEEQGAESEHSESEFYKEVMGVLREQPEWSFEQVYHKLRPGKDIQERDEDQQQILLNYIRGKSMLITSRFGFEHESVEAVHCRLAGIIPPIPSVAQGGADMGFVSVKRDDDGVVRHMPLLGIYEGKIYKHIAFAAVCRYLGIDDNDIDLSQPDKIVLTKTQTEIPLDNKGNMIISWTGDWATEDGYIPATHVARIWQGQQAIEQNFAKLAMIDDLTFQLSTVPEDTTGIDEKTLKIINQKREQLSQLDDPARLKAANEELQNQLVDYSEQLRQKIEGKIVLVGSVATGAVDDFEVSPCNGATPGISIHRNIVNGLLQKIINDIDFIRPANRFLEMAVILLLGLLMTVIASFYRPLVSGIVVVVLTVLVVLLNFVFVFGQLHYWFVVVTPVAAILGSFTLVTFYRQITEGHAKRRITARFKQYTSPALVDKIVSSGDLTFAGEERVLSCFFSDIAGFTTISERLGPTKTVRILNIYLDRMTEVLDSFDATINKFEGDGVFAFFGAPVELPDHTRLSCMAAVGVQDALVSLCAEQRKLDDEFPNLTMRVGICTGEVVVGDCGSRRRFDYTAIGDTVNLAARLESANKAFGSKNMICQRTYDEAKEYIDTRYLGQVRVVGKENSVGIYELLGKAGTISDEQKEFSQLFEKAVRLFQEKQFDKSEAELRRCLEQRPGDKSIQLYLNTIERFNKDGVPEDFDGGIGLESK